MAYGAQHLIAQGLRIVAEVAHQRVAEDHYPVEHPVAGHSVTVVEPVGPPTPTSVGDDHGDVVVQRPPQLRCQSIQRINHQSVEVIGVLGIELVHRLAGLGRDPLVRQALRAHDDALELLLAALPPRQLAADRKHGDPEPQSGEGDHGAELGPAQGATRAQALERDDDHQPEGERGGRGSQGPAHRSMLAAAPTRRATTVRIRGAAVWRHEIEGYPGAMTLGTSLFLIALGAILRFAVTASVAGIDLQTVGLILLIVGVIGLVISLVLILSRRDETVAAREPRDRY